VRRAATTPTLAKKAISRKAGNAVTASPPKLATVVRAPSERLGRMRRAVWAADSPGCASPWWMSRWFE
jgi:hypothetical protein